MYNKKKWIHRLLCVGLLLIGYPLKADGALVGPFLIDSAETAEPKDFALSVNPQLFIKQGNFDEEGNRQALGGNDRWLQFYTLFKPVYGVFNDFEISLDLPVQYSWATQTDRSSDGGWVGDIALNGKYRFLKNGEEWFKPAMALTARIKFPTGKYEGLSESKLGTDRTGTGSYDYLIGLNVSKALENWALHFNLLYGWSSDATIDGVRTKQGNLWNYNLGAEFSIHKNFSVLLELVGVEQGKIEENGLALDRSELRSLSIVPALGWQMNEKTFLIVGCSISLLGKNAEYGVAPTLLLNYNF